MTITVLSGTPHHVFFMSDAPTNNSDWRVNVQEIDDHRYVFSFWRATKRGHAGAQTVVWVGLVEQEFSGTMREMLDYAHEMWQMLAAEAAP